MRGEVKSTATLSAASNRRWLMLGLDRCVESDRGGIAVREASADLDLMAVVAGLRYEASRRAA